VDAGLSMFGVEVVKHCNEIGLMVDVSHCGHLTTLDACRTSSKPVNANHTCARAIYDHARGKTDEALHAIADTGGVIGVVAVPHFLSGEAAPTIEHMLNHIDYIVGLVGGSTWVWERIGLGRANRSAGLDTRAGLRQSVGFRPRIGLTAQGG